MNMHVNTQRQQANNLCANHAHPAFLSINSRERNMASFEQPQAHVLQEILNVCARQARSALQLRACSACPRPPACSAISFRLAACIIRRCESTKRHESCCRIALTVSWPYQCGKRSPHRLQPASDCRASFRRASNAVRIAASSFAARLPAAAFGAPRLCAQPPVLACPRVPARSHRSALNPRRKAGLHLACPQPSNDTRASNPCATFAPATSGASCTACRSRRLTHAHGSRRHAQSWRAIYRTPKLLSQRYSGKKFCMANGRAQLSDR